MAGQARRLVALAQPEPRAAEVARLVRDAGHEPLRLDLIRLDPEPFVTVVREAARTLAEHDLVVFASPSAIAAFMSQRAGDWPQGTRIAVVGSGSVEALAQGGLDLGRLQLLMPQDRSDVDALLRLPELQRLEGRSVLVVRGSVGRDDWIDRLRQRGARVRELLAFARVEQDPPPGVVERLRRARDDGQATVFVVTTTRTAERLDDWLSQQDAALADWCRAQPVLAIHPRIAETLSARGWRRSRTIDPGADALLGALEWSR